MAFAWWREDENMMISIRALTNMLWNTLDEKKKRHINVGSLMLLHKSWFCTVENNV